MKFRKYFPLKLLAQSKYLFILRRRQGLKACANPIRAMACRECLPGVELKGKNCRRPILVMGVAHAFQHMKTIKIKGLFDAFLTIFPDVLFKVEIGYWNSNT